MWIFLFDLGHGKLWGKCDCGQREATDNYPNENPGIFVDGAPINLHSWFILSLLLSFFSLSFLPPSPTFLLGQLVAALATRTAFWFTVLLWGTCLLPSLLSILLSASSAENWDCCRFLFWTQRSIIQINSNKRCLKLSVASSWPSEADIIEVCSVLLSWLGRGDFYWGRGTRHEAVCEPGGVCGWLALLWTSEYFSKGVGGARKKEGSSLSSLAFITPVSAHWELPACSPVPGPTSSSGSPIFNLTIHGSLAGGVFRLNEESLTDL